MSEFLLALDQGTTSSRAILFDRAGRELAKRHVGVKQVYRRPGWVEQDANEIFESQMKAARDVLFSMSVSAQDVEAIGIANQRETTVIWDIRTGEPIHPAIVWQSRQTEKICQALRERGLEGFFRDRTGLLLDAYFSGTKIRFILDEVSNGQERASRGEIAFGTIDSWLIFKMTEGRVHATDPTNASRTLLFDIRRGAWDNELLEALDISEKILPEVRSSNGDFGETKIFGGSIPITAVLGDQQAALFGQGCFSPGSAKNTYGTGCFFLLNVGSKVGSSDPKLLETIAWCLDGKSDYAVEGSVFTAGSAIQWLRDGLGLIESAEESAGAALSVEDTGGVYFVPAFVGLGAPHWDASARGMIIGLTHGTTREQVIRATLESLAYQTYEVLECALRGSALTLSKLRVDGGASRNDFLLQFQADLLGIPVERPKSLEVTAFGVAALAGLKRGFWESKKDLATLVGESSRVFEPKISEDRRQAQLEGWKRAVVRAKEWDQG